MPAFDTFVDPPADAGDGGGADPEGGRLIGCTFEDEMKIHTKDYRVIEGDQVDLKKRPTIVNPVYGSKSRYEEILAKLVEKLSALQQLHHASSRHAVLLIFQAMDAAGKDGAIRQVMSRVKSASDTLYIGGLAAPNTGNTMPEDTLLAFADHGTAPDTLPRDGGDAETSLAAHASVGIDLAALAAQLQTDGGKGFVDSWHEFLSAIDAKSKVLA